MTKPTLLPDPQATVIPETLVAPEPKGPQPARVIASDVALSVLGDDTVIAGSKVVLSTINGSWIRNGADVARSNLTNTIVSDAVVKNVDVNDGIVNANHPIEHLSKRRRHKSLARELMYAYANRPEEGERDITEMTVVVDGEQFRGPKAIKDITRTFLGEDGRQVGLSPEDIQIGLDTLAGKVPAYFEL